MDQLCQVASKEKVVCLSIPSKVVSISDDELSATVETMGVTQEVRLDLLHSTPMIGDFVLIHIGYAMSIVDEDEALETLKIFKELEGFS